VTNREKIISNEIQKNRSRLLAFIRKRLPASDDAEDVLQDVFYRFIIGYDEIKSIDKITSWLFTVARNKITDLLRRKKREPVVSMQTAVNKEGDDDLTMEDIIPSGTEPADAGYMRRIIMEELEEALDELPEEQQEAFIQNELEGKSFKEISEQTGVSINTLVSRKRRAVLYLREHLKSLINEV
jgi:RNA polymerase sigma factor (sigma-70 family)